MPSKNEGSLQGLMTKLWLMKHAINNSSKVLDHEAYMISQGMKQLVGHAEDYCVDNQIYSSREELEQAEFDSTRVGQYNETTSNGDT